MEDSLGDRMKKYEAVTRSVLLPHCHAVIRVDGRSFHSYLRDAEKPFDLTFQNQMVMVGSCLAQEVSGTILVYGQSDEISLILDDTAPQTQPWFGGVVQKVVSVAASIATLALARQRGTMHGPQFDARVFSLPSLIEVENYLIWRQRDAVRNSISMVAQAKFSQAELHGRSSDQMQEMLFQQHGVNWNDYPNSLKRGWVVEKHYRPHETTYTDKRTGQVVTTTVERSGWESRAADHFTPGFLSPRLVTMNPAPLVDQGCLSLW